MLQKTSSKEVVSTDLTKTSLLVVLMQLRIAVYLCDRIDPIISKSWMARLLKQEVKANEQFSALVTELTDLTETNEVAIVGGYVGSINRGQQAYFIAKAN